MFAGEMKCLHVARKRVTIVPRQGGKACFTPEKRGNTALGLLGLVQA